MNTRHRLAAGTAAAALILAACGADGDDAGDEPAAATSDMDDEMSDDMDDQMSDDMDDMSDEMMSETITITIENVGAFPVTDSGVFAVPAGGTDPGPVGPGDAYEFDVRANPGDRLSFATMFVQSNDWFFAPDPSSGIALFADDGTPVAGDVTTQIVLWDAGTEIDQEPGEGTDQAPRQAGPDTGGDDVDAEIRRVDRNAADYLAVTIAPGERGAFTVRVENVSEGAATPTPIAPGAYAVHTAEAALFVEGGADAGAGLEALAEDGDPSGLVDSLGSITGITGPLAPGAYAVHTAGTPLFGIGVPDAGIGFEALAEDGDPSTLVAALAQVDGVISADAFAMPDGAAEPGPAFPGSSYSFTTHVAHGELVSFATMLAQSNDWVITTPERGLAVVDDDGRLISGDVTDQLIVVDAGTETDQPFGFGADQAPRQAGPDTGDADADNTVRVLDDRDAARYVRVVITTG